MDAEITLTERRITNTQGILNLLGISEPTLVSLKKKGIIPYLQIGSSHRYDIEKVLNALEVQQQNRKK